MCRLLSRVLTHFPRRAWPDGRERQPTVTAYGDRGTREIPWSPGSGTHRGTTVAVRTTAYRISAGFAIPWPFGGDAADARSRHGRYRDRCGRDQIYVVRRVPGLGDDVATPGRPGQETDDLVLR